MKDPNTPKFDYAVICSSINQDPAGSPTPIRERTRIILGDEPRRENHRLQVAAFWHGDVRPHEISVRWIWPDTTSRDLTVQVDYRPPLPQVTAFKFPTPKYLPTGTHTWEFWCDGLLADSISLEVTSGDAAS